MLKTAAGLLTEVSSYQDMGGGGRAGKRPASVHRGMGPPLCEALVGSALNAIDLPQSNTRDVVH